MKDASGNITPKELPKSLDAGARIERLEAIVVRMYDLVGNHWVHAQLLAPLREEINKLR